jgi:Domain of unknown function (DUF4293)
MIQRQQTLWLLLATLAAILTFMFPFATGEALIAKTNMKQLVQLDAGSNFFILILTIASTGISAVTIFLFKDRKMQLNLCILGLLVSAGTLVLYILNAKKLVTVTPALWAILPVIVMLSFFMAMRNIRKDEKLVKSLEKLR